jgi:hypothetical protein
MKPLFALIAINGVCVAGAAGATITTANGSGADSFIRRGNATTNYGASGAVEVKYGATNDSTNRKGYLKFDLTSLNNAASDNVSAASLKLVVSSFSDSDGTPKTAATFTLFGLVDGTTGEDFVEGDGGTDNNPAGEIRWDNAPGNVTSSDTGVTNVFEIGDFTISNTLGSVATVNASSLVTFLNSDTNNVATFILVRKTQDQGLTTSFASKENTTYAAPTLEITLVPEPSALSLLALPAAACLRRRRA